MEMTSSESVMTVVPVGTESAEWSQFLAQSENGTLFHDLAFLQYHPRNRFAFHHLMLVRGGQPIALLPGGLVGPSERPIFCSPVGASIGGLVISSGHRAEIVLSMVEALQVYAREQNWAGIQVTLPPSYYNPRTAGLIEFALFSCGFRLQHRWLCPVIELDGQPHGFERTFRARQASFVRSARRRGLRAIEAGVDGLEAFLGPFRDTYERHGVPATHSEDEIRDLLVRLPDRVHIQLAFVGDEPAAALLIFRLIRNVANTFYICSSSRHVKEHAVAFLMADAMDRLSETGFRYLDLGPSASDQKFNKGVTFFKEGLGAIGQCRDRWSWNVDGTAP
jgi:hypothetical protein